MRQKICGLLFLLLSTQLFGQSANFPLAEPIDYDKIDFYLNTIDVGPDLHMKFGHSALHLVDRKTGLDIMFNWGLFNFDETFPLKFYKGDLLYMLGIYSANSGMRHYEKERRSVWQDKLNLTNKQKAALMDKLEWNARRENREYLYEFYFNNCSTVLRDYFDLILQGNVKNRFENLMTGMTYRQAVEKHMEGSPLVQAGLETIMNDRQEVEMSAWHKMFLPADLRNYLLELPAYDDNGQPREGKLLDFDKMLWEFPRPAPPLLRGHQWLFVFFFIPAVVILLLLFFKRAGRKTIRAFGLLGMGWAGISATFGFLMFVGWTWSSHLILKHNPNLALFWLTDIAIIVPFFRFLRRGELVFKSERSRRFWLGYAGLHLIAAALFLIAFAFGMMKQNVDLTVYYMLPPLLVIYGLFFVWAKASKVGAA